MLTTRRELLGGMAKLGGAGAVYETLAVWDFLRPAPALAASLALPRDSGKGKLLRSLVPAYPACARPITWTAWARIACFGSRSGGRGGAPFRGGAAMFSRR